MDERKARGWPWPSQEKYITPYLPEEAKTDMAAWAKGGNLAVQWVMPEQPNPTCRNCQDIGYVYVRFLTFGPMKAPAGGTVTWIESSDGGPAGWYQVKSSRAYVCPHCQGRMPTRKPAEARPAEVKAQTEELALELERPRRDLE